MSSVIFRTLCLSESRCTAKYLSCCACCYCICFSVAIRHSPWMQNKVPCWLFSSELWETFLVFFLNMWMREGETGVLGQQWRVSYTLAFLSGSAWSCWKQFLNAYGAKCVQAKSTIVLVLLPFEMLLLPSGRQYLTYELCSEALGSAGDASLLTQRPLMLLVQKVMYAQGKEWLLD